MTALIIIGAILLVFVGIALIKATVTIEYSDEVRLTVKVLFIRLTILPKKPKKVNYKKFSAKRYRKMIERDRQKELKKQLKKEKKKADKAAAKEKAAKKAELDAAKGIEPPKKRSIVENISLITAILKVVTARFAKHLRITVSRLHLNVATGDAANTAILYGSIAGGVSCMLEVLDRVTNVIYPSPDGPDVDVTADFLSEKMTVDVNISVAMRVWNLFDIAIRAGVALISNLKNKK